MAEEAAGVAAQIREDAERYASLLFSSQLLDLAVRGFRERHEAPTLQRASRYFESLTAGRYTRVETDVSEKGTPFLQVHEADADALKPLEVLSSGTSDQLHLALLLGSLEHRFASGVDPMPLVMDDVLIHFDDERSLATLETLADFSKQTQVLLFTHHERIREQALSIGEQRGVFVTGL